MNRFPVCFAGMTVWRLADLQSTRRRRVRQQKHQDLADTEGPAPTQDHPHPQGSQNRRVGASFALHLPFACLRACCRTMEDYTVVYLGAALFKILRLLLIGAFSVHFFACIFFRVKIVSAMNPDDVDHFYSSRNVGEDVSLLLIGSKKSSPKL